MKRVERTSVPMGRSLSPRTKEHLEKPRKTREKPSDNWGNVIRGYHRTLFLGPFADAGKSPKMNDVEVAVCFADLRGFTDYVHLLQKDGQDNKVQHFLRDYFQIYPEAILHSVWSYEPDVAGDELSEQDGELKRLIVPASYKNLGDGMMIVWELQTATSMEIQGLATRNIMSAVEEMERLFSLLTTDFGPVETDSYSTHALNLKLGFGLARGHAWRLDFGRQLPVDYAGSIINLAAHLQALARPHGIVAQLGFSESLFKEYEGKGKGKIKKMESPKGGGMEPIEVWTSNPVILPAAIKKHLKK